MAKATGRPIIRALLLCERVLQEKDNVLSVMRIIDNITVGIPPAAPLPPTAMVPVPFVILASLKGGDAKGEMTFQVRVTSPSGKSPQEKPIEFTALFENEESTFNAIVNLALGTREEGLYYVDLFVKGETAPQARVPLRIIYAAEST
jgi:hypothetical protein